MMNKSLSDAKEIENSLIQFTGTTQYFQHWTGTLRYTDGIKHLLEVGNCYWLIDTIASYQPQCRQDRMLADFQLWYLLRQEQDVIPWIECNKKDAAVLTCWRDTPNKDTPPPIRQDIPFTDFPLAHIKLYWSMGVLMLPSEY